MSSLERSRGQRTNLNFDRTARAFDETAVPPQALAAKQEVKAANKADICGVNQAGWNSSTVPEGKHATRFPDRPMMRTLAQYDSHKRADYNFRAEQLENQDRRRYYPTTNKFEYNERHITGEGASLDVPPPLARTEFVVNPTLGLKVRWDGSTGSAGDPHAYAKERKQHEKAGLEAALANSKRYQPKQRMGLVEREKAYLEEQRRQKAERRAVESAGGTWYTPEAPLAPADAMEMSMQVPSRKVTTWSLGGF
mmetsp:Transcript_42252/g.92604  ORF Transcript_42252/g.92604 Transcript_42252/m.92604 type:complete len:252 (+) Transcript_42252:256-1011(+)